MVMYCRFHLPKGRICTQFPQKSSIACAFRDIFIYMNHVPAQGVIGMTCYSDAPVKIEQTTGNIIKRNFLKRDDLKLDSLLCVFAYVS